MAEGDRRRSRRGRPVEAVTRAGGARLTVLGSSCSIPRPGRACSSYLIEFPGTSIVADFGTGAFARLVEHRTVADIDAVVISHMHADHFIDLVPLRYALKYGDVARDEKVPVYLPPGGPALLRAMTAAFLPETGADFLADVFDIRTYEPNRTLHVGDVAVRFAETVHYIPTYAMRFSANARTIAYGADSAPAKAISSIAHESDLFVCEATLDRHGEMQLPRGHSSAREAAAMAEAAGVKHLVLSHYPASLDAATLEREAGTAYGGRITIADDGTIVEV